MLWSIGMVSPLPAQLHPLMSTIPGSMNQPSKHLRHPMCKIAPQSSPQMAAYDAWETRQYNRNRGIKTNISVSRGSRNIQNGEDLSCSIWNSTKGAVPSGGSSVGLRRLRRFFPVTSDINTHSGIDSSGMCCHDREGIGVTSHSCYWRLKQLSYREMVLLTI